ncbi:hypothetical protein CXB51_029190 [Gossypium anomalum]|uniref:Uncharacterized protein n=1 Tax=Gossypium anomalum TaxID=47600 RepID=A0A8J5Z0Q9_9ROSI|nr:hypothetical protein CXB51_029190 [Gossypium anomalum]
MDRPPSTRGLPVIFMLDHLLLEDDEVSQSLSLNIKSSQKTRKPFKNGGKGMPLFMDSACLCSKKSEYKQYLGLCISTLKDKDHFGCFLHVSGFSSENGLNNAAMMGYAFDPNKNYVFVVGLQ